MSGKAILVIILAIVLIVVCIVGGLIYREWKEWTSPWGTPEKEILIEIERGMTARQIADLLVEKGVLENTTFFLIMADLRGFGGDLKAGEYMIRGDQSPDDIVRMIDHHQIYRHPILFPEGITRNEIAQILEENGICKATAFLDITGGAGAFQNTGMSPSTPTAEGFLFPDTYLLEKNLDPGRVRDRMIRRFNQVYEELREEVPEDKRWWEREDEGSLPALLTLASLVEREAKRDEDRPLVASVFRNRLKKGMKLQSNATIRYILGDWTSPLKPSDFEIDDPYNTFKYPGLPPSPICNPGAASLKAAMIPPETDYLYFMATGDGKTEFSKTLNEHNSMRNRVRRGLQERTN